MQAWRISKTRRAGDLSGKGASFNGGRWNNVDVPAVYMGLTYAISYLETLVHANGTPTDDMTSVLFELPEDKELYWEPKLSELPEGWQSIPPDRPSMEFGSSWLSSCAHLGMIIPSAIAPLENNMVINPGHPAISRVKIVERYTFSYDPRLLELLTKK